MNHRESIYTTLLDRYLRDRMEARKRFPDDDEAFSRVDDACWARYLAAADELARSQPVRLKGDANG